MSWLQKIALYNSHYSDTHVVCLQENEIGVLSIKCDTQSNYPSTKVYNLYHTYSHILPPEIQTEKQHLVGNSLSWELIPKHIRAFLQSHRTAANYPFRPVLSPPILYEGKKPPPAGINCLDGRNHNELISISTVPSTGFGT